MIDPVLVDSGCDENLVCGVCTLVLRVPMSGCPQGHTFCERCYRTHLIERPTCPTCRHSVTPDGLVRNRPIENMVLTLRVACSHSDPSVYLTPCGWKGTLGELDAHLGSSCPNEPVSCPHAGCVVRLPRRLLAAHARDECTRRPVPCQHCGLDVAKSELAAHEAGRTAVGSALMALSQAASPAACVVRPRAWAHPRIPGRLLQPGPAQWLRMHSAAFSLRQRRIFAHFNVQAVVTLRQCARMAAERRCSRTRWRRTI